MKTPINTQMLLTLAIGVLVLLACWLAYDTRRMVARSAPGSGTTRPVYLPLRFLHKEPECAGKLMDEMQIRNVHVVTIVNGTQPWRR